MKTVNIYTDGACSGNQNKENAGGWGCILEYEGNEKELCGGEINTTNNRMELTALIEALKALKEDGLQLNVFSDSSYLTNCFKNKWYEKWQTNGWITGKKEPVENRDLWEELLSLLSKHQASFYLVKGHVTLSNEKTVQQAYDSFVKHNGSVNPERFRKILEYNSRCDELATKFQKEQG